MILNVFERLLLRNIVPQIQGWNFGHMKEARLLLEDMFTPQEEENLQIKLKEDGKGVTWRVRDDEGNDIPQVKDMDVSDGLKNKLAKFLKDLNRQEKLGFEHYSLYEKLVEPGEGEDGD